MMIIYLFKLNTMENRKIESLEFLNHLRHDTMNTLDSELTKLKDYDVELVDVLVNEIAIINDLINELSEEIENSTSHNVDVSKCGKSVSKLKYRLDTTTLRLAFRLVGINCDNKTTDKIIDLVELIEERGNEVNLQNIAELEKAWLRNKG